MTHSITWGMFRTVMVMMAIALLAACHSEEPPSGNSASDDGGFYIRFAIAVGPQSATRSFATDNGTDAENAIDVNDLKILVFDKDEKLYDVIYDDGMTIDSESNDLINGPYLIQGRLYYFNVSLKPGKYNDNSEFAIVALANWKGLGSDSNEFTSDFNNLQIGTAEIGTLTIQDLKSALFTLNPGNAESWTPGNGSWVPMFGSKHCSLSGYSSGAYDKSNPMSLCDDGDIDMVRAFAKIEVINNDTSANAPEITKVELCSRNTQGRLMHEFDFKFQTSQVSSVSLPDDPKYSSSPIQFRRDGNKYTAYLPEMEFIDTDRRKAICITVDLGNGTYDEKWIWFAPYINNGRPLLTGDMGDWNDIKRNHIYRYEINSLGFEFQISCSQWIFGDKIHINLDQSQINPTQD